MKFREVVNRLTGISTPVFGVSWQPPKSEIAVAARLLNFLADCRVLYNPSELEMPEHCVTSVIKIRHFLTDELGELDTKGDLAATLRAMRAACRKFLDTIHGRDDMPGWRGGAPWGYAAWVIETALGEMRGVFGVHIAQLSARYGLDVEEALAQIIPGRDEDDRL